MRKLFCILLLVSLMAPVAAQAPTEASKLRVAGSQFEIIGVLLDKQDYPPVLAEHRKILNLQFGPENEKTVVQAMAVIVDRLREAGQYGLAMQITDQTLASVKLPLNKYSALMIKGKLLKDQGRFEEAIDIFQKAQQFAPEGR
jgi:tetratricopeptide (TPR) repeat protein